MSTSVLFAVSFDSGARLTETDLDTMLLRLGRRHLWEKCVIDKDRHIFIVVPCGGNSPATIELEDVTGNLFQLVSVLSQGNVRPPWCWVISSLKFFDNRDDQLPIRRRIRFGIGDARITGSQQQEACSDGDDLARHFFSERPRSPPAGRYSVDRSVRIMLSESGKDLLRPWENVETPIGCHSIQDSNKKSERVDK